MYRVPTLSTRLSCKRSGSRKHPNFEVIAEEAGVAVSYVISVDLDEWLRFLEFPTILETYLVERDEPGVLEVKSAKREANGEIVFTAVDGSVSIPYAREILELFHIPGTTEIHRELGTTLLSSLPPELTASLLKTRIATTRETIEIVTPSGIAVSIPLGSEIDTDSRSVIFNSVYAPWIEVRLTQDLFSQLPRLD